MKAVFSLRVVIVDWAIAVNRHPFHPQAKCAFELKNVGTLFANEERRSQAVFTGASGAANAVNEVFCHFRQIVVNHVGDFFYVDAASSHIRGYQHAEATLLESSQGCGALRLRAITVDGGRGDAFTAQTLGDTIGATLGTREDQAATAFFMAEKSAEQVELAIRGNFKCL